MITFTLNGVTTTVSDEHASLLDALREECKIHSLKDGCAPQGQCGCCTVMVDGRPRVSCVTPLRRIAGCSVETLEGIDPEAGQRLAKAMLATGASQCGFCTPGIVLRVIANEAAGKLDTPLGIDRALAAHSCRCTGWQPIVEAIEAFVEGKEDDLAVPDEQQSAARALLEGGIPQVANTDSVLGRFAFASDRAPEDALIALRRADGSYAIAESLAQARLDAGSIQGRNTTVAVVPPLALAQGYAIAFRTAFVDQGYLEPDGAYCEPGGDPVTFSSNGGGFGAKRGSSAGADARSLADEHQRSVRVLWPREELARHGAKRPPLSLGVNQDAVLLRVASTPGSNLVGLEEMLARIHPAIELELVEIPGPPLSMAIRGAVEVELLAALALRDHKSGPVEVISPEGARASVEVSDAAVQVTVDAGRPLCSITLRSYVIGAVHQALGLARHEGIAVDASGAVLDLSLRSLGQLSAAQMPQVDVEIIDSDTEALPVSIAVMAATFASAWLADGRPSDLPSGRSEQEAKHHG